MRVVTVATKSAGYFPYLLASCQRFNVQLDVLGWGTQWQGFNHRLHLMQEFLDTLDDDEVVLFIDAYDVVLIRDPAQMEIEYRQRGATKVAIAVENMNALSDAVYNYLIFGRCTGKALNAGTYMGTVRLVRAMLSVVDSKDKSGDDQRAITDLCRVQSKLFHLDELSEWFLVSGARVGPRPTIVRFVDGEIVYEGRRPFVLHCPGNADMAPYLKGLGYTPPTTDTRRTDYGWRLVVHQLGVLTKSAWESPFGKLAVILIIVYIVRRYRHMDLM